MQNSPARTTVDVGTVIAGTYTIEALIGRGGMGAVFLATHNRLPGKKVAIKLLHAEIANDDVLARFKREAQIASMLGHPNIVGVENFDVMPDGTPYLVLEYLQGQTLAHRLDSGPLAVEPALSIVRQIGSALAAAHRAGIVHRDLKPQNIFLVPTEFDGRVVEQAKVLDFGISKMRGSQTVKTQDSALLGTPQYMAPEQATGQHAAVDERTDIFAFGAIVYEMLSGRPAFEGANIPEVVFKVVYEQPRPLEEVVPGVPPQLAAAVHRALAKPQADRFANVGELVEALTGKPLPVTRQTQSPSLPPVDTKSPSSQRPKSAGSEAFAQTVGSGDHSGAMPLRVAEASTPSLVQEPDPEAPPPAPRRSRAGWIIGGLVALGALAAGGVFLAIRHGEHPHRERPPGERGEPEKLARAGEPPSGLTTPVATETGKTETGKTETGKTEPAKTEPAKTEPAKTEPAKTEPAKTEPTAQHGTSTHEPAKTEPALHGTAHKEPTTADSAADGLVPHPPKKEPAAGKEGAGDGAAAGTAEKTPAEKLVAAERALERSDFLHARLNANSVLNSEEITPAQAMKAHVVLGVVACLERNDDEGAMIQLNKIRGPKLRRRVIEACHRAGRLQGIQ